MGKITFYIVSLGLIWLIVCAVWPFWNKYRINTDLKAAAVYGTKHSTADAQRFFREKLKERGYEFNPDNFDIDKSSNNAVSIRWTYQDKISFFGIVLKKLNFTLDVTERERRDYL